MTKAESILQALDVYLSFRSETPSKGEVAATVIRASASILRDAYANEEYPDHPDDFLFDIANELDPPTSQEDYDR